MQASNKLKSTFVEGKQTFGAWQMLPGANVSRLLARSGVDWVLIDCEHGNIDGALDSGAHGIIVPLVRTVEEAKQLVLDAKFPPLGRRGFGSLIALERFNPNPTLTEYLHQANDALVTIIQIETREAFESVEEIAAVDGIDALFIGPFDLGNNIGYPIQKGIMGPELKEALARILAATRRASKKCGIYCKDAQQAREFAAQGYDMLVAATDYTTLQTAVNGEVTSAKGEQAGKGTW
ncbi:HpcH-HpaI domain-containing protein [Fusarium falciforme]|uniref:HpcH-HpaI domain-containing protein n=1 Tax=Fusarium falciforme TaxID=195108 RepID=UPI0023013542|nr:HpcH-HpaI domain-containing protein [Fusarium falciforme]WAO90141.1 HpcH-HpaI domain-containing protein [Fusarium falciforme]